MHPIIPLAISMHAKKSMYALLLGSGISSAAQVPTGHQISLDLIRKVARLEMSIANLIQKRGMNINIDGPLNTPISSRNWQSPHRSEVHCFSSILNQTKNNESGGKSYQPKLTMQ
jgi:hypothetical protein